MRSRRGARWCRGVAAAMLVLAAPRARAQVFQLQGGGSSLFAGYGGLLNVWGDGYEASLGVGYLDGIKVGAAARRLLARRDTLRLGNDMLPMSLDTDVFGTGGSIFAQGASLQRRRGRTQTWLFAGASASALSAPLFGTQRAVHAMTYARARYDLSRTLSLTGHAIATNRQSLFGSARWEPAPGVRASATVGAGSNAPYGALSLDATTTHWDLKGSLVGMGRGFRRASAPMPLQTELERENVLVAWRPRDGWSLGVGRQHFRQDSAFVGIASRASLTQVTASGRVAGASLSGGWLLSDAGLRPNISSYLTGRRDITRWLQSELYLLRVWQPAVVRSTTPVLLLRETLNSRLSLLQVITRDQGRTSVSFGGTVTAGLSSIGVDYQVAHSPYLSQDPFVQTMGVTARLHLRGFTMSFGSFVTPDGRVHYSAQGNTFLYRGFTNAAPGGGRVSGYVASGRVVDESGTPVDGAALEVGGEVVYTDSKGRFFVRRASTRPVALRVVLDDFLTPGMFEVVEAPAQLHPARDERAVAARIVLRRVHPPVPTPLPATDNRLDRESVAGAGVDRTHLDAPLRVVKGVASAPDGAEVHRADVDVLPALAEGRKASIEPPHVELGVAVENTHGQVVRGPRPRKPEFKVPHRRRVALDGNQGDGRRSRPKALPGHSAGDEQCAQQEGQQEPEGGARLSRERAGVSTPAWAGGPAPSPWRRGGVIPVHAVQSRRGPRTNFTPSPVRNANLERGRACRKRAAAWPPASGLLPGAWGLALTPVFLPARAPGPR